MDPFVHRLLTHTSSGRNATSVGLVNKGVYFFAMKINMDMRTNLTRYRANADDCKRRYERSHPDVQGYHLAGWMKYEKLYREELAKLSPTQQLCTVAQSITGETDDS